MTLSSIVRTQCEVHAGTLVHVIFLDSSFHPYRPAPVHAGFGPIYTVSNRQGLLITCPDITITPTRIAESCVCTRR